MIEKSSSNGNQITGVINTNYDQILCTILAIENGISTHDHI